MNYAKVHKATSLLWRLLLVSVVLPSTVIESVSGQQISTVQVRFVDPDEELTMPFIHEVEQRYYEGLLEFDLTSDVDDDVGLDLQFILKIDGPESVTIESNWINLAPGRYRSFREGGITFPGFYGKVRRSIVESGALPAGFYTVTLQPIANDNVITIPGTKFITVRLPEPAIPISPIDDDSTSALPVFTWVPAILPAGADLDVSYELLIVEVLPGQTPLQALEANPVHHRAELDGSVTSFVYSPELLPFEDGSQYAWRLRTILSSMSGPIALTDEGVSEIYTFTAPTTPHAAPDTTIAAFDGPFWDVPVEDGMLRLSGPRHFNQVMDSLENRHREWVRQTGGYHADPYPVLDEFERQFSDFVSLRKHVENEEKILFANGRLTEQTSPYYQIGIYDPFLRQLLNVDLEVQIDSIILKFVNGQQVLEVLAEDKQILDHIRNSDAPLLDRRVQASPSVQIHDTRPAVKAVTGDDGSMGRVNQPLNRRSYSGRGRASEHIAPSGSKHQLAYNLYRREKDLHSMMLLAGETPSRFLNPPADCPSGKRIEWTLIADRDDKCKGTVIHCKRVEVGDTTIVLFNWAAEIENGIYRKFGAVTGLLRNGERVNAEVIEAQIFGPGDPKWDTQQHWHRAEAAICHEEDTEITSEHRVHFNERKECYQLPGAERVPC